MLAREYVLRNKMNVSPEILHACEVLENYGFLFGHDFTLSTAVDKVTAVITEHADKEEALLKEDKQISEKIAVDEPLIQDRRTFTGSKYTTRRGMGDGI